MTELYEKLDHFTDYWFDEISHSYTYKGLKVHTSVTQLINRFVKPFEREYWLDKKSKKLGITPEELAAQWREKAEISQVTGTLFHEYMENSLAGKRYNPIEHLDQTLPYKDKVTSNLDIMLPLGRQFIEDTRHKLIPIKSELTVGIQEFVAGQIDQLFYNTSSKKLEVWDWKTNNDIKVKSSFSEKMLKELIRYDACEYYEYSLQLNLYKEILRRHGIDTGNCYFVWFNRKKNTYQCYKCADMVAESIRILDNIS